MAVTNTQQNSAGSGTGGGIVAIPIDSLTTGQQYRYRVVTRNESGQTVGAWKYFTPQAAVLPTGAPEVITGAATAVTQTSARLNGSVDPNNLATDYYFEWGATTSYGNVTPTGHLTAVPNPHAVVAVLTSGLIPGSTVHFRLVATNSAGTTLGGDMTFIVTAPPTTTQPEIPPIATMPLVLTVEVTTADGNIYVLDHESAEVENRPLEMQFGTQEGNGFAEASYELARAIDRDYPDLNLLDVHRFVGADGSIAYEGRVAGLPRRVDDSGEFIRVELQGLMASAKDRTFTEIYVDRSGERWSEPSLLLRKATMDALVPLDDKYTAEVQAGSITFNGTTPDTINQNSTAIVEYKAPSGNKVRQFQYVGEQNTYAAQSDVVPPRLHGKNAPDDVALGSWTEHLDLTLNGTRQAASFGTPRDYAALNMTANINHSQSAGQPEHRAYTKIAVYGTHTAPLKKNGSDPYGVYAAGVIRDIISRFCPMLNADGVAETTTLIAHLVFDTPTTPFDAFSLVNGYHLWSLGCWENGTVSFAPADLTQTDWQVRTDDPGVTDDLQGDTVDSFANGISVSYEDVDLGQTTLTPNSSLVGALLSDTDPDNPANKQGIELWTSLELSVPADTKGALALGKAALAEFNRVKAPGTVNVSLGYIQDQNENLQPTWKVRAGDTLSISDLPFDSPRLITQTSWSEDGTLQITLEQPATRIDAVLARLDLAQQASGIGGG